jgi:photosystem II stability/assembly factor-like uncharacterized protein
VGPPGGDARSLALHPKHPELVFLGTADGILYRSENGGDTWQRLVPGFPERGYSLDEISVDENGRVLVAYWQIAGTGGGVARSDDGGKTFTLLPGIAGESVRALAVAGGKPDTLVVGTLTGVFRSDDGGAAWRRISPAGHAEIRNVESIAIDPRSADVIYAGTWHLPWKTKDGGKTWRPIKTGMIDDSDVFTLTLDRRSAETLYGTACSGIYRSADAGGRWAKVRGIPASSRRTRAFLQHRQRPQVFFAGTTEGLWRSEDDLQTWRLVTGKELVVNAVTVLPSGRVLAAADGAGILRSEDAGETWASANDGFSERFVSRVLFDPAQDRVLAAIREDRQHAGVLASRLPGGAWSRLAGGLEGREVLALALSGGTTYAGTDAGVFRLREGDDRWLSVPLVERGLEVRPAIRDLATLPPAKVFAASSDGLLTSDDGGGTWHRVQLGLGGLVDAVVADEATGTVWAATPLGLFESRDRGTHFGPAIPVPASVHRLVLTGEAAPGSLLAATTSGLYRYRPGQSRTRVWYRCGGGLPETDIAGVHVARAGRTLFASDFRAGGLYRSDDAGATWRPVTVDGLRSSRLWALAADPRDPERLLAAAVSGGLHLLEPPSAPAAATR